MKKNAVITECEELENRDELGLYTYHYYIDEARRVVTCVSGFPYSYDCCVLDDLSNRTGIQNMGDYNERSRKRIAFILPDLNKCYQSLVGVARCHPDDKWDVSIGKKVAKHKLKQKYHSIRLGVLETFYAHTQNIQEAIVEIADEERNRLAQLKSCDSNDAE